MWTLKQINALLPAVSFVTALAAFLFGLCRFHIEGRRQRRILADGLYQRYLEVAMANPEISWPIGKFPKDPAYPWLVAIMCNALAAQIECERNLPGDMLKAIKADLKGHRDYFESSDFECEGGWTLFPARLKELYEETASGTAP